MFGVQRLVVFLTVLLAVSASPRHQHDDDVTNWQKFSSLLDTVDEAALHVVLHALSPKFKDGIFSKDRTAIEHVHSEDPVMASKLVHIAKRQGGASNDTTTSSTPPPTTSSQEAEPTSSATPTSVESSISSEISSQLSSEITASTVPSSTSVLVPPSTPTSATPIATRSGAVVYSTIGGGVVTLTSSAVGVHFSQSTSTHLFYSTLPNGNTETSTSVVVVNAPVTATNAESGAAGAATTSAGLQNSVGKNIASGTFVAVGGITALLFNLW